MFEEAQMSFEQTETSDATSLITVTQLPIIEERLRDVKATVEAAVAEAKSMVATEETIQAVKARRTELNKQFDALEEKRKAVKAQIMEPYNRFEAVYKECITIPFGEAEKSLKATVDGFQNDLKEKTVSKLKAYYEELCGVEGIDWLPFMRAMQLGNIKVGVGDAKKNTPKKLMDQVANVVSTVALGIDQIKKMDDAAEIMAEYKVCLDVGKAVATVQERKRAVEAEKEAAEKRKEFEAKRAEALAKVEAAAAPATAPAEAPVAVKKATPLNKTMRFSIHFDTVEQYEAVKPILAQLKETLKKEGIRYE